MNKLLYILLVVVATLAVMGSALAITDVPESSDVKVVAIEVNGRDYRDGRQIPVDLGDTLKIRVEMDANDDVDNLEVSARLVGYEYADQEKVSDVSDPIDLKAGDSETVDLSLTIPLRADKDTYELRVDVDDRRNNYGHEVFTIRLTGPRKGILIRDVLLTPSGSIESGRSVLAQARLENIGDRDEDDVKVTVAIPALQTENSVYMNDLEGEDTLGRGEKKTSEELYLRIPPCARPGTYDLVTTVEYDEYEHVDKTQQITITDGGLCSQNQAPSSGNQQKVIVTAPSAQTVQIGVGGASFPVVIQNNGNAAKTFNVAVTGLDWGTYQISDAAPVVQSGETKVVYIYVSAASTAMPGARTFGIDVVVDGQKNSVTAQAILTQAATSASWKTVLTWVAVILLVIVIILAIIVAVRRMKGKSEDEDDLESDGQAYY